MGAPLEHDQRDAQGNLAAVMRWFAQAGFYFRSLFQRRKMDEQLSAEIQTHVDLATDANARKGMSPEEAVSILEVGAGTQWDPSCVAAFLRARG